VIIAGLLDNHKQQAITELLKEPLNSGSYYVMNTSYSLVRPAPNSHFLHFFIITDFIRYRRKVIDIIRCESCNLLKQSF